MTGRGTRDAPGARAAVGAVLAALAAGCGGVGTARHASAGAGAPAPRSGGASAPSSAGVPPSPAGLSVSAGWRVSLLGPGFGGPDDLAAAPAGGVYFSDVHAGELGLLPAGGGTPALVARDLDVPEGIAVLPSGMLLVAEQGKNRILRVDPATGAAVPWMSLSNPTDLFGVDGIALAGAELLIPDSPMGTLLQQDGAAGGPSGEARPLAVGMRRPTGAAEVGGTIYVADETGDALYAVPGGGGALRPVAALPEPDDVSAGPGGTLLVTCLGDGTVRQVNAATGAEGIVLSGLGSPQGLAAVGGAFAVADEARNRIYLLAPGAPEAGPRSS